MAKIEISPEDLNASHIGQYVRVSLVRPLEDETMRETFVIGALLGVEHKVEDYNSLDVETVITVEVAVNEVSIFLPTDCPVAVSETVEDLLLVSTP